jgi:Spy/CpxP family protein refolding chaperone
MKKSTAILIAAATLVAAGAALAQSSISDDERGPRGAQRGPGVERLIRHLDLTAEQQEAIEKIREESRTKNAALAKETRLLRHELEGELMKDEPAESKVLELNARLGELRTERQGNRLAARLAVREQLTPEQRDRMLLLQERRGGRGQGSEFGRGGRGFRGHGRGQGRGGCGGCEGCDGDRARGGRGSGRGAW